MRPTWGPHRADRNQVGPMLAHESCYQVYIQDAVCYLMLWYKIRRSWMFNLSLFRNTWLLVYYLNIALDSLHVAFVNTYSTKHNIFFAVCSFNLTLYNTIYASAILLFHRKAAIQTFSHSRYIKVPVNFADAIYLFARLAILLIIN